LLLKVSLATNVPSCALIHKILNQTQLFSPLHQLDDFSVRAVSIPEPEKAQKAADLSFVFFVEYDLDCKQLGL
jgi:hypothetical protein